MRTLAVWLVLMGVETLHGALRTVLIAPRFGDFAARQISVFTGSVLIVLIACSFVGWIRAGSTRALLGVGLAWLVLTVTFELGAGRLVFGRFWQELGSDYAIWRGGLLPIGLIVLALSPLIAARLRN